MARVLFDCERLTLARRLRGLRKNQLAEAVGTTPKAIGRYEAGVQRPDEPTVRRLAITLGVPVTFFGAGRSPVSLDGAHFRSLRSTSQIERDQALAYGRIATDVVAALEELVDLPEVELPEYVVPPDEIAGSGPVEAARLTRKALVAEPGPVPHVVRLLEAHGVVVLVLPDAAERVDAFSVGVHPRPMVFFNPAKGDYWRNRFDGAHELGHLVMHADAEPGEKIVEDQAHRFAAEFLMPADEIGDELPAQADWERLAELKAAWGVSMAALLYRARTLGVMTETAYRTAMSALSSRGWRRQEPGPARPLEQPTMLTRALEIVATAGTDRDRVAALAHVTRADLDLLVPHRRHTTVPNDN
ncbi:ImmA/IrrE family metallo-endopeptidase [Actinomadura syzygii]|uniref:ImmA/IrrE family metallo-endopeptidase n=1 Tax=Actinomadura syzygii TaxID=1427538 RepID=A0A5D0ULN3_9ACTN|nr:ImmA/IrrE family metallo-endopeptidase [Actinomadura syzygii]